MTREQLFLEQLALIERVIGWVCARRGLRAADAEDFASAVKMRLIENDYEVLGKFEGRSALKTYLTSVISRIYLDFQVQRFGKWRSSAAARQLGPVAMRLEQLLSRDGLSFDEACGVLKNDPQVKETREELEALHARLPVRPPRRSDAHAQGPAPIEGAEASVDRSERQELADRIFSAIRRSLGRLPARDRIFLRLHFQSGLTVAQAARVLGADQKALYRKKEDMLRQLRSGLEADSIGFTDAQTLLSELDWEAALSPGRAGGLGLEEPAGPRPSQGMKTSSGGKV
jgi:RNA polymerase sigma factor (sigma-70 family)